MAGLVWSDHIAPNGDCPYDHVEANTPLGTLRLAWKGWKSYDPPCCEMPWGGMIVESSLEEGKKAVQESWNNVSRQIAALAT